MSNLFQSSFALSCFSFSFLSVSILWSSLLCCCLCFLFSSLSFRSFSLLLRARRSNIGTPIAGIEPMLRMASSPSSSTGTVVPAMNACFFPRCEEDVDARKAIVVAVGPVPSLFLANSCFCNRRFLSSSRCLVLFLFSQKSFLRVSISICSSKLFFFIPAMLNRKVIPDDAVGI